MRLGRKSIAVVAGAVALLTWAIVFAAQRALFGIADGSLPVWAGAGAGLASVWLAERFDLVAPALTPPVVDLYAKDEPDERQPS
jgi:hypothetical protein